MIVHLVECFLRDIRRQAERSRYRSQTDDEENLRLLKIARMRIGMTIEKLEEKINGEEKTVGK